MLRLVYHIARQIIAIALWVIGLAGLGDDTQTWGRIMKEYIPFISDPYVAVPLLLAGSIVLAWTWSDIRVQWIINRARQLQSGLAEPDMPMRDLFVYLVYNMDDVDQKDSYEACVFISKEVTNRLRNGTLQSWGEEFPDGPLAPIAAEDWRIQRISIRTLVSPEPEENMQVHQFNVHIGAAHRRLNLHVCRDEVLLLWPRKMSALSSFSLAADDIKRGAGRMSPEYESSYYDAKSMLRQRPAPP